MLRRERGDPRGPLLSDLELVQIGVQAVARMDGRDRRVVVALDHVNALAVPFHDVALPPR